MSPRAKVLLEEVAAGTLRLRDLGTLLREQNDGDAEQALAEHFRQQFAGKASPLPASNPVELDREWNEVIRG